MRSFPLLLVLLWSAMFTMARPQSESPGQKRALLKGVLAVRISTAHAHPVGLDWDLMQKAVEDRLRAQGIALQSSDQTAPTLNLDVSTLQAGAKCAYWVDFELTDQQPFKGDASLAVTTVLWREHLGQVSDLANLQQSIQSDVANIESRFLDDWAAVNSRDGNLTGTWDADSGDVSLKTTWQVRPDGTATMTSVKSGTPGKVVTTTVEETYRVDGKSVYFDVKSVSFKSDDPTLQKQLDQLKATEDKEIKDGKAKQSGTIEWRDKDTAVVTLASSGGKSITLRRKSN